MADRLGKKTFDHQSEISARQSQLSAALDEGFRRIQQAREDLNRLLMPDMREQVIHPAPVMSPDERVRQFKPVAGQFVPPSTPSNQSNRGDRRPSPVQSDRQQPGAGLVSGTIPQGNLVSHGQPAPQPQRQEPVSRAVGAGDYNAALTASLQGLPDPASARAGFRGREDEIWAMITGSGIDPKVIADDIYARVLGSASGAAGGGAAQRAALFQAANTLPQVLAQGEREAANQRVEQARLGTEMLGETGRQELAEYQVNVERGLAIQRTLSELVGKQLEFDQRDQEVLAQATQFLAGLDAQMAQSAATLNFNFAQLSEQAKWQLMDDVTARLGISAQAKAQLDAVKESKRKDIWDKLSIGGQVFGNVAEGIGSLIPGGGKPA